VASEQLRLALQEVSQLKEAAVHRHLMREYFLLDGHKFGCAFLAYDKDPDVHHAKALVFLEENRVGMSRLAGIAKK
jgi:tRNA splicing endonuclease